MLRTLAITLLVLAYSAPLAVGQISFNGSSSSSIEYTDPKTYTVGGITVEGVLHLDANAIVLLSGLSVGDKVDVPGERISSAIRSLWKQQLFSDVKIKATKIQGSTIFLAIELVERPRLSRFKFNGVSKSEADNIRDIIQLYSGKIVTENLMVNTKNHARNYFIDKGYHYVNVNISKEIDTAITNSIYLVIDVDKGERVKINDIVFIGNESISDGKLHRAMKDTKRRKWYRLFSRSKYNGTAYKRDKTGIVTKYNVKGFRDASLMNDTVYKYDEKSLNVEITIDEGNKYYFRNISWVGNTKYTSEDLSKILGIKAGDTYNQATLEGRLFMDPAGRDITSLYMDDGYLFFQVQPVEVLVENDSIDFEMRIIEGKQARVNRIIIRGNTKTNDHVILREIRVKPGDLFSRTDIIRTQRELAQLGYFDPEKLAVNPLPNPADGTVDIEFIVEERPSDQIELSGGWGAGRIVGTLGLSFNNFSFRNVFKKGTWDPLPAGDGQRLSIRAQSNGTFYQSYNVSFTEPWLGGKKPNSLSVSAYHSVQSNGETRNIKQDGERIVNPDRRDIAITGVSVGLGKRLKWPDDYFTTYKELSYQHYNLNNFNSVFSFADGVSNNVSLRFTLSRNSVNKPIYPDRGSNLTLTAKITPPFSAFDGIDDYTELTDQEKYRWIEYHKWKFTSSWFTPLSNGKNKLVLNTRVGFGFLGLYNQGLGHSPFERFYLGGSALTGFNLDGREIVALRGYDDLAVSPSTGGVIISKYTMELRYPLSLNPSATIYALAFAEAGNTWNKFTEYNPFEVKRSAGIGLRIFLPMFGLMGLDYGLGFDNLENTPGFLPFGTSRQGQFHFTIGTNLGEL
jgi:outer membrane protein insertion porin family